MSEPLSEYMDDSRGHLQATSSAIISDHNYGLHGPAASPRGRFSESESRHGNAMALPRSSDIPGNAVMAPIDADQDQQLSPLPELSLSPAALSPLPAAPLSHHHQPHENAENQEPVAVAIAPGGDRAAAPSLGCRGPNAGMCERHPAAPSATTGTLPSSMSLGGGGFTVETLVGQGAYGSVFRARTVNGDYVALKKMRMRVSEEGVPMMVIREISILRYLEKKQHKNIVKFLDVMLTRRGPREYILTFAFEFVDRDLATYIKHCPPPGLPCTTIKDFTYQMMCGVQFLHENKIVHRDIKPQNILVSSSGVVKIADFGLSRVYTFVMALTSVVVTLWYRAPEVLFQATYASPVDMWSCGCILGEMLGGRPMFGGDSEINQLVHIFDIIGLPLSTEWPEGIGVLHAQFAFKPKTPFDVIFQHADPGLVDILERTLQFAPHERATAEEILALPMFDEYMSCAARDKPDTGELPGALVEPHGASSMSSAVTCSQSSSASSSGF